MNKLYSKLAEILETDIILPEDDLDNFPAWDSLGVLCVISMVDEEYDVLLTNTDIKKVITAGDLEDLIKQRIGF